MSPWRPPLLQAGARTLILSQPPACLGDAGDVKIYRAEIPLAEPFYTSGKLVTPLPDFRRARIPRGEQLVF
jgi:hypothetical protein